MSQTIKLTKSQALPILRTLGYASTRSRSFAVRVQVEYAVNNGDLIWQGGSKTEVTFLRRRGEGWNVVSASDVLPEPVTGGGATLRGKVPADVMIVEYWRDAGREGFSFVVAPGSTFLPPALEASRG